MTRVTDPERVTQDQLISYFTETLGYEYLGKWQDRENNSNIEGKILFSWLKKNHPNIDDNILSLAIDKIRKEAQKFTSAYSDSLYENNKNFYRECLAYSIKIIPKTGEKPIDIPLIDWKNPGNNHFAIAEEVTVHGETNNRPDLVIYINGIAIAVIELKRSKVNVTEGIRQNIGNQKPHYIRDFFTTVQLLIAGNETQGIYYGTIETPEKYYTRWIEEENITDPISKKIREIQANTESIIKKDIVSLCYKERLLDIIQNYVIFDGGIKKIARHNQYYAITNSLQYIKQKKGGIIWHTQGSGKSLTMVWLTSRIMRMDPSARILIITDRDELDKQIKSTFLRTGETTIERATSGKILTELIKDPTKKIICTLIHKFGQNNKSYEELINDIKVDPGNLKGNFYIFIDEAHRTQSGKLHAGMKRLFKDSIIIGFTGTPLLKTDITSVKVFGGFIHKYTYDKGVKENIILDLIYESRNIGQYITSEDKIEEYFNIKTKELTEEGKYLLKRRWGNLKKLYSANERINKIVIDICMDMEKIPRLSEGRGNAILIADSIYNGCKYYELFQKTDELAGKCALLTSYDPDKKNLKLESTGEGKTEEEYKAKIHKEMWGNLRPKEYEEQAKDDFVNKPAKMKLLIVIDRFLTGFDAPPATYLYIDKHKENQGLFQAICRVNRKDTPDKEFGYIVDYENLFDEVKGAMIDYTDGDGSIHGQITGGNDDPINIDGMLKCKRLKSYKTFIDNLAKLDELCEPLYPSKEIDKYVKFFCNEKTTDNEEFEKNKPKREMLYQWTASLLRAWVDIKREFMELSIENPKITFNIAESKIRWYSDLRKEVALNSKDLIDLTRYDPGMRSLIDRYVGADDSEILCKFEHKPILDLIEAEGIENIIGTDSRPRKGVRATAETVERNISRVVIEKRAINPEYYDRISSILQSLIREKEEKTCEYKEYLKKLEILVQQINHPERDEHYPENIRISAARRALYDASNHNEDLAIKIDCIIVENKDDEWKGHEQKERKIKRAMRDYLKTKYPEETDTFIHDAVERYMIIAKNQDEY